MTIYRPKIKGGPAGDVGLAALAHVVRYGYAMALIQPEAITTDESTLELFAAFLAGHGPPSRPDP